MIGSNFKRDNLSLSLKSKASEKVDLSFTFRYSNTEINGGGANEQNEISSADARLRHSVGRITSYNVCYTKLLRNMCCLLPYWLDGYENFSSKI